MADEIRFYHLQKNSPEQTLIKLLPLALDRYGKIVISAEKNSLKPISDKLWQEQSHFLPHGVEGEKFDAKEEKAFSNPIDFHEQQPIYLNHLGSNANQAKILLSLNAHEYLPSFHVVIENYDLACVIFSHHRENELQGARTLWRQYNPKQDDSNQDSDDTSLKLTTRYYKEDSNGQWQEQKLS